MGGWGKGVEVGLFVLTPDNLVSFARSADSFASLRAGSNMDCVLSLTCHGGRCVHELETRRVNQRCGAVVTYGNVPIPQLV